MHGIRAVRRESGTKDPPSRKAPRVFSFPAPRRLAPWRPPAGPVDAAARL
jgi:hypothetical protein